MQRPLWLRLVILGVVFFAITQGAQFVAIDSQPAATASLMLSPTAFLVATFSTRSLGERASRRQFVGAVLLLAAGLVIEGLPDITVRVMLIIGWLAVANTAVAFTLWNRSLRRLAAVESAAINNTMLVQIAALAWIFLGEGPGAAGVAGILIVSFGAFLTTATNGPVRRKSPSS